jgi:hypothetical protein
MPVVLIEKSTSGRSSIFLAILLKILPILIRAISKILFGEREMRMEMKNFMNEDNL